MQISLSGLKVYKSMSEETLCFEATVVADGVKVGRVTNDGHGGSNHYDWSNRELGRQVEAYAESLPMEYDFEKLDQLIGDLVDDAEEARRLKALCKGKLVFRYEGGKPGEWYTVKVVDTPANRSAIAARSKSPVAEWANDRFPAGGLKKAQSK